MELTDLEICKRIAEIEGFEFEVESLTSVTPVGVWPKVPFEDVGMSIGSSSYNPLTDDALCFKLLVKHNIDLIAPYLPDGSLVWEAQIFIRGCSDALSEYNESPNKAICLAIIEAHND